MIRFVDFSESVRSGEGGVSEEASAALLQIQEDLSSVQAHLDSLELEKQSLARQLKNCCRNDSFYTNLVQDHVNLILGQVGVLLTGKALYSYRMCFVRTIYPKDIL